MTNDVVQKGDFALLTFEGKIDGGQVFEKTQPENPALVVVGSGQVIKGLDDAIVGAKVGEQRNVHLATADAFGPRKEELIRLVPLNQFQRNGVDPKPGQVLELDGVSAKVMSVEGGRVRVDFNHELAGKDVDYSFKVEKTYRDSLEKVKAAAKSFLNIEPSDVSYSQGNVRIMVGPKVNKDPNYFIAKTRLVSLVLANMPEVLKFEVNEVFELVQNTS